MAEGTYDKLNRALFAQLEKLELAETPEAIEREAERSKAVSGLAQNIIANARNALRIAEMQERNGMDVAALVDVAPKMLGSGQ